MDSALGTRDLREIQHMMKLFTKLWTEANKSGAKFLSEEEEKDLLFLTNKIHNMLYGK